MYAEGRLTPRNINLRQWLSLAWIFHSSHETADACWCLHHQPTLVRSELPHLIFDVSILNLDLVAARGHRQMTTRRPMMDSANSGLVT
jgi:hypothetical protein